ncbi:MAG: M24 family metallopeptidase [Bdellovibrionota bacterium]|nr:M24 family metallopeptidase [Bdellovibrionota bacterium]
MDIQRTGPKFDLRSYLEARTQAIQTVDEILSNLEEGMSEKDGKDLINDYFLKINSKKKWHPSKFRIGKNTLKSFKEESDEQLRLKKGDAVFIDVGPVIGDHEADIGKSIVFSPQADSLNLLNFIESSKELFHFLKLKWQEHNLSGESLYKEAEEWCLDRDLVFNPRMAGHRLGDFPHALISRESLANFKEKPKDLLWVLEIHIINPKLQVGSFFEDILIKNDN